jgi:hypothetical protein
VSHPPRRTRSRRSRRRRLIRRTVALLALLTLVSFTGWWIQSRRSASSWHSSVAGTDSDWSRGNLSQNLAALAAASAPRPAVYPYSVVPGGVRTPQELHEVSTHDGVVAKHYAGFDFQRAKVVELDQAKLVYLSYRIGNKVFWTKKKVHLRKGEKLITDGKIAARTRCANRVSESAQNAVSPEEPPAEKFEEPMASGGSATQIAFPGNFESALLTRPELSGFGPEGPPGIPGSGSLFGPGGGGGLPPIFPPTIPGGGCDPRREKCPQGPPPAVPEPSTILLMSSGLAGIYLRYRRSASKK